MECEPTDPRDTVRPAAPRGGQGRVHVLIGAFAVMLAVGCGHPGKQFPVGSFDRGQAQYNGKRLLDAVETLKLFIRRNPRDPRADDAQFLIGQCYMTAKQYPLAAVELEILRSDYPTSDLLDDALFLEGMAYALQRPNYRLDQKVTHRAFEQLQKYLVQFPAGKHRDEVQAELVELQTHLDRKRLAQAHQYASLRQWAAAAIVLDDMLQTSPDSRLRPDMLLLRGEVARKRADVAGARGFWSEVVVRYPNTAAAARARRLLRAFGPAVADTTEAHPPSSEG